MHLTYRKTCRICGSGQLTKVIDLGEQYLQGSFIKSGARMPALRRIPTELVRCDPTRDENGCGLLQTAVTTPPEVLYSAYWYRSGTNQTMRDHLKEIASKAVDLMDADSAVALDIGCNDGTLLRYFPSSYRRIGIDPSNITNGVEINSDLEIIHDFFPSAALRGVLGKTQCDIITSIAMFYDLEDPLKFVRALKSALNEEGVWIFEMSYMPAMLEMNSYDTICHEHLEYYSFSVIERLLSMCGMKVFNVTFNDINGGSIRCYATHDNCFKYANPTFQGVLAEVRNKEFDLALDTDKPYQHFQERIDNHKKELSALLKDLRRQGKIIHAYGASTKGNTILQWCGIDQSIIPFAADRNPQKAGARTLGTDISIVSEEESRKMKPDYYLVLPWHFREEFVAREAQILNEGTKFIFPLPNIEIVGA